MILFPNAKINLGLHVLRKRDDNYHDLETIMVPVGLSDMLEFLPANGQETRIILSGLVPQGKLEENLVIRAYNLLKEQVPLPALNIHLHKQIPAGAGLGGGSSDGAFMLKGLNTYFKLGMDSGQLCRFASQLGSDCSFFIENTPSLAEGKGEIITPLNFEKKLYHLLLLSSGSMVSTAEAYSGIQCMENRDNLTEIFRKGPVGWPELMINDFERNIFALHPEIGFLKKKLYKSGALYASMSGSGSVVFGVFQDKHPVPDDLVRYVLWEGPVYLPSVD